MLCNMYERAQFDYFEVQPVVVNCVMFISDNVWCDEYLLGLPSLSLKHQAWQICSQNHMLKKKLCLKNGNYVVL